MKGEEYYLRQLILRQQEFIRLYCQTTYRVPDHVITKAKIGMMNALSDYQDYLIANKEDFPHVGID